MALFKKQRNYVVRILIVMWDRNEMIRQTTKLDRPALVAFKAGVALVVGVTLGKVVFILLFPIALAPQVDKLPSLGIGVTITAAVCALIVGVVAARWVYKHLGALINKEEQKLDQTT